jgi:hypothetical protein
MLGQFFAFLGILKNRIVPKAYLDPTVLIAFNLSFSGIIGLGYFLTLGQGIRFVPPADLLITAALLNFSGLAILYFLSLIFRLKLSKYSKNEIAFVSSSSGTLEASSIFYLVLMYLLGSISRFSTIQSGRYFHIVSDETLNYSTASSGLVEILSNLPLIVTVYLYLKLSKRPFAIHLLWLIEVPYALLSGTRQDFLQIAFVIFCLLAMSGKRRIKKSYLVKIFLSISIILVFPMLQLYRSFAKYQSDPLSNLYGAFSEVFSNFAFYVIFGVRLIAERASDLVSISRGMDRVGSGTDLLQSGTTEMLINALVPRFLIPEKMDLGRIGNEFGRSIGISTDRITSITFPPALEGYSQGRFLGTFLVCLFYSIVIIWFSFLVRKSFMKSNYVFMACYIATVVDLYNSVGNVVALGLIGYLKGLLIWCIILSPLGFMRKKSEVKVSE